MMGKSGAIATGVLKAAAETKASTLAKSAGPGGRPGPPSPVHLAVPSKALEHATVPVENLTAIEASIVRQVRLP